MDILLNSQKNVDAINVNNYKKVELLNKSKLLTEYDSRNVLSASDVFESERETTNIYRIYGKFEYFSQLNGLKNNYMGIDDIFIQEKTNSKNILNSFDFYLLKPSEHTNIIDPNSDIKFVRNFEVIATPKDIDIYKAAFSNNVFGEQEYLFNVSKDIDISNYFETYNTYTGDTVPVTELYLYPLYKIKENGYGNVETLKQFTWNDTDTPTINNVYTGTIIPEYSIGDIIYGDIIEYGRNDITQRVISGQSYQIQTPVTIVDNITINWKYNPFIPIRLRYLSNDLSKANGDTTSYEQQTSIPEYAINLFDNNYIWREILPQGYFDPISGVGVDYPFQNNRRYLYSNIIFDVIPDLSDEFTLGIFTNLKFGGVSQINHSPIGDINNIGMPCQ